MKHTPGPWKYTTNVGPTKALIVEQDGTTVVEIGNRTHDSRFKSNVKLIAAAPDLLKTLHVIHLWYEECGYNGNGPSGAALLFDDDETLGTHIKEALAKAGLL